MTIPSTSKSALEVIHGDLWAAFDANPNTVAAHGVTRDKPAAAGFASTVRKRPEVDDAVALSGHFGTDLGRIHWLTPRIGAGVTQPHYHEANAALITEVVALAGIQAPEGTERVLVPFIGGGLGGLSQDEAMRAIEAGAELSPIPVTLYLWS